MRIRSDRVRDMEELLNMLREQQKRNDIAAVYRTLERLSAFDWKPVWEWSERLLQEARETRSPETARNAANVCRLLEPWSGNCKCGCGRGAIGVQMERKAGDDSHASIPTPLPWYIEAIRIWCPEGWLSRFGIGWFEKAAMALGWVPQSPGPPEIYGLCMTWYFVDSSTMPRDQQYRVEVWDSGSIRYPGDDIEVCPPLPEVPEGVYRITIPDWLRPAADSMQRARETDRS